MNLEIGQVVGEYEVVQEVGGGGNGCVYKVEHTITKRIEAIKVLAGAVPSTEEQRRRFHREIQVHARLCHANIAAVHNAFWIGDNLVMVMEYLEGPSLQQLLEEGRVRPEEGIRIVRQVLHALAHAHAQGVVHRDISPANIIVGPGGLVKLTDFGLAKRQMDTPITTTGALVGSLCYMSPEQVRGTQIPDARSDIYSCGVVLYEVSTGRKPFSSTCAFTLMRAHVELPPVPPAMVNPGLPPMLNDIILRALAKDPEDRFQTADDFCAALGMIAAPEPAPVALVPAIAGLPAAPIPVSAAAIPAVVMQAPAGSLMRLVRSQAVGIVLGALFMTAVLGAVFWTGDLPGNAPVTSPSKVASTPAPVPAPALVPALVPESPPQDVVDPLPMLPLEIPKATPVPAEDASLRRADRTGGRSVTPRVDNLGVEPVVRRSFRPPEPAKPRRETIRLAEPPPLTTVTAASGGPGAAGVSSLQPFQVPSQEVSVEAPPPPPSRSRIRRFFGKVLNPFRSGQSTAEEEK